MPNTKPVGVAYEDPYLDGATIVNPVYSAKGAALTTQLTTITSTAPGTPDYAIQDLTSTTPSPSTWLGAREDEIAHRRDATIKAMIDTPPKKHKDEPKQDGKTRGRPPKQAKEVEGPAVAPRGRGRPRKQPPSAQAAADLA